MKKIKWITAFIAAILFQGCASLPTPEQMQAEVQNFKLPKYPDQSKALVYVVRPSHLGSIIRFNVFLDDKKAESEMGYTRGNQYIYFNVSPGKHTILSQAEILAEHQINAKAGDIVFIQQETYMGILMARNRIYKIDEVVGKYHVKHSNLGTIIKIDK